MLYRTALLGGALALLSSQSLGHGAARWIQDGNYKNNLGDLCCGERDCAPLAAGDVEIIPGGYWIKSLREAVPFAQATPAPAEAGGLYWRCYWGGQRKCFFYPFGGV